MRPRRTQPVVAGAALLYSALVAESATGQGWVREPPAEYQSYPQQPLYRDFIPTEKDLSHLFPVPGDQGRQGSCTAWAVGYAMRSYYEGLRQGWDLKNISHQVSPASIYNPLTQDRKACASGLKISDALKLLKRAGASDLAAFPYSPGLCASVPAPAATEPPNDWRIADWRTVNMARADNIKGEIANGHPVAFGLEYSQALYDLRGSAIYDDIASPRDGGHAMVAVGYSDARQAFKVMNSWGTRWAENGFGWISYRAMTTLSDRGYVMSVPPAARPQPSAPQIKPPAVTVPPVVRLRPELPALVLPPPPREKPPVETALVVPPKTDPRPEPQITPPPAVEPLPPAPVPPAPPSEDPRARLARELAGVACARVNVVPATGSVTALSGFVASEGDRQKLAAALGGDGGRLASQLEIRPWPQCEVMLTFTDAFAKPRGLSVEIRGAKPAVLKGGSRMIIEVTTPDYPTYLYVTYLQTSEEPGRSSAHSAVHLVQPVGLVPKPLPPNTKVILGDSDGGPVYRVGPPYGQEMVVAIAAASPLFATGRPQVEIERDYLTGFRLAFLETPKPGAKPRIVAAAATTLVTGAP